MWGQGACYWGLFPNLPLNFKLAELDVVTAHYFVLSID